MLLRGIYICLFFISSSYNGWTQKIFFSGNDYNSSFICEDGTVLLTGKNDAGQLGNGSAIPSNIPLHITGIDGSGIPPACKQVQIEGVSSYIALTNSGDTVIAWGINNNGQIGDGTIVAKPFPVRVKGVGGIGYLQNIKQVCTGNFSSYALTEDGRVVNWGYNFYGQLSNGSFVTNVLYPDYVLKGIGDTLKNVKMISSGGVSCLALLCDGTVWAWGRNNLGQLAQNNTTNSAFAIQVKNSSGAGYLSNIKTIESGDNYCFALSASDTLWSWGSNAYGQLGIGSAVSVRRLPTYARNISGTAPLSGVVDIAAGQGHSIALLSDGTVVSWGKNSSGQLGNNNTTDSNLPLQVMDGTGTNPLSNINYIATGDMSCIVRTSSNQLFLWGENGSGQLGLGDYNNRHLPAQLSLSCPPVSDVLPSYGKMINPSNVCTGSNSGNIYIKRHQFPVLKWQISIDDFLSFSDISNPDFSQPYLDLNQKTYYRTVLTECGNNYYSPVTFISTDPKSQPGILNSSDTVREQYNKDTLHLNDYQGDILRWEYSSDRFISNIEPLQNNSNAQIYSELVKTTYYRAAIKSGTCPMVYSNVVEIRTISEKNLKIYNSFTPNGDNYNDEWVIDFIELFPNNKVEIFNRWGQLVFKAEPYNNTNKVWRGESNVSGILGGSTLADGTFFYMVDLGENYTTQKGYIVISR